MVYNTSHGLDVIGLFDCETYCVKSVIPNIYGIEFTVSYDLYTNLQFII